MEHRMSTLELKELSHPSGEVIKIASGKTLDLKSQGTTTLPTGSVLQVVSAELTARVSMATQSFQNTGLIGYITPSSASSKILITVSFGRIQTTQSTNDHGCAVRLMRGSVDSDLNGVAASNRSRVMFTTGGASFNADHSNGGFSITGIDSPNTTSQITYNVQAWPQSSSYPIIINGTVNDTDESNQFYSSRTKAIITMMEIQG
jgi:hypothetical protein